MNFFRHLAVKKTRLPCLVRGFLAYMFSSFLINMQYVKTVCEKKKKKKKMCVHTGISCAPRGNKGFGNLLNANFVQKKICFSTRTLHQLSISDKDIYCRYLMGK